MPPPLTPHHETVVAMEMFDEVKKRMTPSQPSMSDFTWAVRRAFRVLAEQGYQLIDTRTGEPVPTESEPTS